MLLNTLQHTGQSLKNIYSSKMSKVPRLRSMALKWNLTPNLLQTENWESWAAPKRTYFLILTSEIFKEDSGTRYHREKCMYKVFLAEIRLRDSEPNHGTFFIPRRRDTHYVSRREFQITALAGVVQWIECGPVNQSITSSIPSLGTCLGCRPCPQFGMC